MKEYELENHDSYVNCIDNNEIRAFYKRYIKWLEKKLETLAQQPLSGSANVTPNREKINEKKK